MRRSIIAGVGGALPDRVVTNQELADMMDTSDAWIVERSGIRERRWVDCEMGGSDLALAASQQAVAQAGLSVKDIDCIVFATLSPDYNFPGSACLLQDLLELPGIAALDVRNQCSGFIYSLSVADAWIRCGQYDCVLVVGAEVHSTGLDKTTRGRDVTCLFGDGAGAVLLTAGDLGEVGERGLLSTHLHADGKYAKALWVEAPGSRLYPDRLNQQMLAEGKHYTQMQGRRVFSHAIKYLPQVILQGLTANGLSLDDMDLLVPHQANLRINEAAAKVLGISMDKVYSNIERYGNTTAASIPLALRDAEEEGRIHRGDLLVLASFGAGFTWASAVLRW